MSWKDDKFVIPDDIKDKPEEVTKYYGEHYGERYKDYDALKTRAAEAEEWGKLGKREEVQTERQTLSRINDALRSGKVIVTDKEGRIFAKDPSELTTAEKRQVQQQQQDDYSIGDDGLPDNFDDLTPRQQAAAIRKANRRDLDETVAAKEKQYGETIQGLQGSSQREVNTILEIQAALQDHPSIKVKDLLTKMATLAATGTANPLKAALDEITGPARIEELAKTRAAEIIAEEKLKTEKARSEKVLTTGSPIQQMIRARKQTSDRVTHDQLRDMLNEKGLLS